MLVAACPGPSRRAQGRADAWLKGVMESQERPHQSEHNPKMTRKSNLGSGGQENQRRSQDTTQTSMLKESPAVREQGLCHRAWTALAATGWTAQQLLLCSRQERRQLFFSQAFGTRRATARFCFIVPMISRVNCNQHIPSPSASKGRSQGGNALASLGTTFPTCL